MWTASNTRAVSEPKSPARPPQAALAGWLVVGGSVIVVLTALGQGAALHSLDTREAVEDYLSRPPGDQLGLGVQGMLSLLRVVWTVAAVAGAAMAVLGWFALQRSKGARLALSWVAAPLFVTSFLFVGTPGASIFPAMVSAAVVMLWFQPARDWFDGIAREAPTPPRRLPAPPTTPTGRDPLLDLPPPTAPPLHPTPYAAAPRQTSAAVGRRPNAVTWACVLTWSFAVPAVLLFAATIVAMLADPQQLVDELFRQNPDLADQGLSEGTVRTVLYAACAGILAWSAAAAGVAVLAWRRVGWAAAVLRVSAGVAAAFCVIGVVTSPVFIVPLAACAATLALLLRPEARAWLRAGGSA